jgi:hypothetical protein
MIGASMVLGIATAATANPCMTGTASAVLQSLSEGQRSIQTPRSFPERFEAAEKSAGIARIGRAPALA